MKKFIKIIITAFIVSLSIWSAFWAPIDRNEYQGYDSDSPATAVTDSAQGGSSWGDSVGPANPNENDTNWQDRTIAPLNKMNDKFFQTNQKWSSWIYNFLVTIAKEIKNVILIIASIYFLIMVLRLIYTQKTEEEFQNTKKTIIWISVWLIIMQSAYSVAVNLYQPKVDGTLWQNVLINVINPLAQFLLFLTWFLFVWMMVYSAYRLITANGQDDKMKKWKDWVIYAIIWYIMVKISGTLIKSFYGDVNCWGWTSCKGKIDLNSWVDLITDVVNWVNTFILVVVTIIIIYAWGLMVTSSWNEEKMEQGKKWLLYALIGTFIVSASYTITIFFLSTDPKTIKPPF
jgi:hypothetical protein